MLGQRQAAVRTGSPLLQKVSRTPVVLKRRSGVLQVQCNAAAASWQASAIAAVQQQPVFQLAASVIGACQQFINVARDKFSQAFPQLQNVDKQVGNGTVA